jgi:hypothetical protein
VIDSVEVVREERPASRVSAGWVGSHGSVVVIAAVLRGDTIRSDASAHGYHGIGLMAKEER